MFLQGPNHSYDACIFAVVCDWRPFRRELKVRSVFARDTVEVASTWVAGLEEETLAPVGLLVETLVLREPSLVEAP